MFLLFFLGGPPQCIENEVSEEKNNQPENNKKIKKSFLRSLLCCLGRKKNKNQNVGECVCGPESPLVYGSPRYLLPPVRHQDMHKKCMVIDLDETLVHSSFKVSLKTALFLCKLFFFSSANAIIFSLIFQSSFLQIYLVIAFVCKFYSNHFCNNCWKKKISSIIEF